jgi:3-oxoacyl-[acyl-carrier protein] reductase
VNGLDDAVLVVAGVDTFIGGRVAACLGARGAQVVGLARSPSTDTPATGGASHPGERDGPAAPVAVVQVDGEGPEAVVAAVVAGAGERRVAAVVHAEIDPGSCREARLAELTPQVWRERCAVPIDRALWTARAGFQLMATGGGRSGRGGVLGFVCPSVALTGAAGHVALATTSEAIRLLAKSAARRWGRSGITSNAFAPSFVACHPAAVGAGAGEDLQVHAAALAIDEVDPADDIAALLLHLAGPTGARLTGATIGTDAGDLMAP